MLDGATYEEAVHLFDRERLADPEVARLLLRARPIGECWVVETLCREAAHARTAGEFGVAVKLLTRALREPLDAVQRGRLEIDLAMACAPDAHAA